ncbi:MAG: hypothetical protein RR191_05525 [Cetobacterium sp.]
MYFMIGTGVLGVATLTLARELYCTHKKAMLMDIKLNRREKEVVLVVQQRDENKKRAEKAELKIVKIEKTLRETYESESQLKIKNKKMLDEKIAIFDEMTSLKKDVGNFEKQVNSLKAENKKLENKLKLSCEENEKTKRELIAAKNETKIVENNVNKILNGSRKVKRDFINNGMKNIEFYR